MKRHELTAKQKAFADHYIIRKNGVEAARLAGYMGNDNTLAVIAHENLRKPKIRAHIDRAFSEQVMSRDEVLARLASIAGGDAADYLKVDEHDSRVVMLDVGALVKAGKGHLIKRYSQTKRGTTVELYSAHEALRDLAKVYRLFGEEPVSVEVKIINLIRDGRIPPEKVRDRWPNLADRLFTEAGVDVSSDAR